MNLADLQEELGRLQMALGAAQVKGSPAVVVTHVHVEVLQEGPVRGKDPSLKATI